MDQETKSQMVAAGMLLQKKEEESIRRQSEVIASAFEFMMVLSPETALDILQQLNDQINEESVEELINSRQEYFDRLKERVK